MNTPKIRFKGFKDDWEQRKLEDISQITAGGTPSTKELTYWEPKEVPWLASGEVHKKYIYDTDEMISEEGLNNSSAKWVEEGSVLIALAGQGKTRGTVAITRIPVTTNQSIAAIKFNDILDADYAFHNLDSRYDELRNISSGDGTRGGLNKQLLADLTIAFPQICEQREIGEYFTNLDHLITLHQRKCDETKELKKFMLQKMFPKNGEKNPEIRFEGFTDDWEQRKVLDLLVQPVTDGPHETPRLVENGIPFISVDAIVDNKIDFSRKRGDVSEEYDAECCKKYKPQYHDVYVVKSGSTVGKVAIVETTDRFNIWSPLAALRCEGKTKPYYLFYLLQTRRMQAQILDKASNGTQPNLSMRELEKFDVLVTDNAEEQQRIGDYFKSLDHLITLHQRKCEKLKELKKFMLQNMFV